MTYVLSFSNGDQSGNKTVELQYDLYAPDVPDPVWEVYLNGGNDIIWIYFLEPSLVESMSVYGGTGNDYISYTSGGSVPPGTHTPGGMFYGGDGNDTISGSDNGEDTIDGGIGADLYIETNGSDIYYVDSNDDKFSSDYNPLFEVDTVRASIDYALPTFIEALELIGTADLNGSGNLDANHLTGNSGSNILDGLQGGDTLEGLQGDDIYVIDSTYDVVIEKSGQGFDIVESGVSYTLSQYVEQGFLNSAGRNQNLTGNTLGNLLVGNSGRNQLSGMNGADELRGEGGNDTLIGGEGIDTLDGGTGADRMEGGQKNDLYYVDNGLDQVIETDPTNAGGYDTVFTSVAIAMPDNVEKLIFNGFDDGMMLSGNDLANYLQGNYTDDIIEAGAGNDTGAGGSGNDSIGGGTGNDSLTGDYGDDTLQGDAGRDALTGGQGADTFVFIGTTDSNGSTTDTIRDFQDDIDRIDLRAVDAAPQSGNQAFTFIGTANFNAAGQIRATYDAGANVTRIDVSTDGDAAAEMSILLSGNHTLTAANFLL